MAEVVVAFTVSGQREKYLRATLDAWSRVRGIEAVRMVFCCEPEPRFPVAEFRSWCAGKFSRVFIRPNEERLGCLENTRAAADAAFALGADFAVVAEEDITVATDVLEFFTWAQRYADDPEVVAACAHAFRAGPAAPEGAAVRVSWFSPLVWGTWRADWEGFIRPGWGIEVLAAAAREHSPVGDSCVNYQGWDLNLRLQIRAAQKYSIFPARSRALHIGETSTLTVPILAEHFYRASLSGCFAPEYKSQEWTEIKREKRLGLIV
jgi:hypothetical protein